VIERFDDTTTPVDGARRAERRIAGHQDDRQVVVVTVDFVDECEAVELRHVDVGDHAVEVAVARRLYGGHRPKRRRDTPAFVTEHALANPEDLGIIVDHEDAAEREARRHMTTRRERRTISSASRNLSSLHGFRK
jgi:hypothetical protein